MKTLKNAFQYLAIMALAFAYSLNFIIFIFPNSFAPSGIDGICTMVQDLSGINIGYLSLLVNIPLLTAAYLLLNRKFAVNTAVFCVVFSLSSVLLKQVDISRFSYYTATGTSIVLAPIAAGVVRGILYVLTLRLTACSGGFDIIASLIKRKHPHYNLMNTIFVLNLCVAVGSYFVYGFNLEPVICSIIYAFTTSTVTNRLRYSSSETIKYEIITSNPQLLCSRISDDIHIASTILPAKGGYSGEGKSMVISVMSKSNASKFEAILKEFDDAVVFKSIVNNSLAN